MTLKRAAYNDTPSSKRAKTNKYYESEDDNDDEISLYSDTDETSDEESDYEEEEDIKTKGNLGEFIEELTGKKYTIPQRQQISKIAQVLIFQDQGSYSDKRVSHSFFGHTCEYKEYHGDLMKKAVAIYDSLKEMPEKVIWVLANYLVFYRVILIRKL